MAVAPDKTRRRTGASRASAGTGRTRSNGTVEVSKQELQELLEALRSARDGEVGVRLPAQKSGLMGDVARAYNQLTDRREGLMNELYRVSKVIGREGRMTERAHMKSAKGSWADSLGSVNRMIDDLVRPQLTPLCEGLVRRWTAGRRVSRPWVRDFALGGGNLTRARPGD